jgi:hypothetical protein
VERLRPLAHHFFKTAFNSQRTVARLRDCVQVAAGRLGKRLYEGTNRERVLTPVVTDLTLRRATGTRCRSQSKVARP